MSVGAELLAARNARGISLEELGARTKVSVERLDAIERSDLERLPPRVYLLGFVKAYANEVGLEPDDVAQRYVAQVEQEWAQDVRGSLDAYGSETVAPSMDAAPVTARSAPPPAPTGTADSEPLWRPAQFNPTAPDAENARDAPPRQMWERTAFMPAPDSGAPIVRIPLLLLTVAIAVAVGLGLSITVGQSRRAGPASEARSTSELAPSSNGLVERAAPDPAAADDTPIERPVPADTRQRPAPDDLSGEWSLTTRVDSSTYNRYKGLTLGYALQLQQHGNRITGFGGKVSENGRALPAASRTPIALEGTVRGQRLELEFIETGSLRTSGGTLVMDVGDDGSLQGRFSSDAAQSRGTAQATRASSAAANATPKRDN